MTSTDLYAPLSSRTAIRVLPALLSSVILASASHGATFTVNATGDFLVLDDPSGPSVTLREALRDAANAPGPDTVVFAPILDGQTIVLNSEIPVNDIGGVVVDASSLSNGIVIHGGPNQNRIFFLGHAVPTSLTLRRLTLTGGDGMGATDPGLGGAIHNRSLGNLILENCTLTGNTVGGAIFNAGSLTLTKCTLFANSASSSGGAIQNDIGTATLVQCTLSGNTANSTGGQIANNGTLLLRHCTLTFGQAGGGSGGIHNPPSRTMTLDRCIVTRNTAGGSPADVFNSGTLNLEGASVIGAFLPMPPPPTGGGVMLSDPPPYDRLAPLANNGGPTQTHALLINSAAIDVGGGSSFTTDQRGKPIVGNPDAGAFEAQAGGVFSLGASSHAVKEGDSLTVTVRRTDGIIGSASVRLITVAGTATSADYAEAAWTLNFTHGDTTPQTVTIPVTLDAIVEGTHSFTIRLDSPLPTPASSLGTPSSATVTIHDAIPVTNLNDSGPGSLRQAFDTARANPGPDAIAFASSLSGKTIHVVQDEIAIQDTDAVTVDASNLPAGLNLIGMNQTIFRQVFQSASAFSTVTLRGLTLSATAATAIVNSRNVLRLERCTLHGNRGGIAATGRTTELTQCTVSENSSSNSGGGISVQGNGTLSLIHCTVTGNAAVQQGGGVYVESGSTLLLNRSIIVGNTAPTGPNLLRDGAPTTLQGTNVVGGVSPGSPGINSTAGTIVDDPPPVDLAPLAANGGPTKTHALLSGSPALNAGQGSAFTSDQRGLSIMGILDVGAYEVQAGGIFTLSAKGYSVNEGAGTSSVVTVRRNRAFLGTASVRISTTPGSASASDYTTLTNQMVNFADGIDSMPVNLTITANDGEEANESFTVTLNSPSTGTSLGALPSARVTIIDPSAVSGTGSTNDTTHPGIPRIISPALNASVGLDVGSNLIVTGTVTDNKGVKAATAKLNGGPDIPLTLTHPGASTTAFTGSLPGAIAGTNKLTVTASDFVTGPVQSTTSALWTFMVLRPLGVSVVGIGSVTTGFLPKSYRAVGSPQTITATPGPGYLLERWLTTGSTDTGLDFHAHFKPRITFLHREGLRLTAVFKPNPFLVGRAGTYHGLVTHPVEFGNDSSRLQGYMTVTAQTTGAFSGSVKLDGFTTPFAGVFDVNGIARFGTSRATSVFLANPNQVFELALKMNIDPNFPQLVAGSITLKADDTFVTQAGVSLNRVVFSSKNPVPDSFLTSTGGTATYSVIFRPAPGPPDRVPQGTGYGSFTVSRTGVVTLAARLPDNTPFTQTTTLSQQGTWPLFSQLYPARRGCVLGNMIPAPMPDPDFSSSARWYSPIFDRQHYAVGWPDGMDVTIFAAKYTPTDGESVIPVAQDIGTDQGNATLRFTDGLLSGSIAKNVDINDADVVTEVPPDDEYHLIINRTTGVITGSILHPDGTRPTFSGVSFQRVGSGLEGAHGFFMTTTPKVKDYSGQSGDVFLDPQ